MAPVDHREKTFEEWIERHLLTHGGYLKGDPDHFNREYSLDGNTLFNFIRESQPESWQKLQDVHGTDVEIRVLQRLSTQLDERGMLDVLRNGFLDHGIHLNLAYFAPASNLNPETIRLYKKNILTVTRQVRYSNQHAKALDLVLSINGLPVATAEIKNPLSGQNVDDGKKQYREDRDPDELLFQFKKRAIVHFVVDPDEVYMTTKLSRSFTLFLPFNQGDGNGAGNPPNPRGYKTSYLWEKVWQRDSWLDIFARFVQLEVRKTKEIDEHGRKREVTKESIVFPRFHQLDAVRRMEIDVKEKGVGQNYLIQHSAGSGKSFTIGWTAYRMSNIHDANDHPVFDSVIVITDRIVLDQQLQETIYQFDHTTGVVKKIDRDSDQLADALKEGEKIIVTTIQKFPFVLDKVHELQSRRYAVIVDEAHSSQAGETTKALKAALLGKGLSLEAAEKEEAESRQSDSEDEIIKSMHARGKQKNISFFAFTATPKYKTLETFGTLARNGKPEPFHLYSMRQAIEEGFIMDILQNYTTYAMYFKVTQKAIENKQVDKKKASVAITNFVHLHPHNISEKSKIIVEHFKGYSKSKIGGQAKAMVVTRSRLHSVKYKQAIDDYLRRKCYNEIKALVAFSGTVIDENGEEYTESSMNGFGEKQLPEKFGGREYQILVVADKYQTGYDQPLLHSMYVDKRLAGLKAVQTLSRLNRTHAGKEDTFVLDFANNPSEIQQAFQQYYEQAIISEETDPNIVYDIKDKLEGFKIFSADDVDEFCTIFFNPNPNPGDQGLINAMLDSAVHGFKVENSARQEEFKSLLVNYIRQYQFLSQLISYEDIYLEKLHAYSKFLLKKLPQRHIGRISLTNDVALEYYKLQKVREGRIALTNGSAGALKGPTDVGTRHEPDDLVSLDKVIDALNKRYGNITFTDADRVEIENLEASLCTDDNLVEKAKKNSKDNFKFPFSEAFEKRVLDMMDRNPVLFTELMNNKEFREELKQMLLDRMYQKFKDDYHLGGSA